MRVEALSTVVAALESGKRPKGGASSESGTIPSLGGEHLNNDGGFRLDNLKYIEEQFFVDLKKGAIKLNDILIVKDGATTGKVSYVGSDFPFERAAINEHLFALTVDSKIASPRYVFSFLKSPLGQKEILKDFRGAAIGGISRGFIDLANIPLPSLDDQIRIAHLLGKVEGLIAQRKQHLQQLDDLLKSVFLEMFGPTNPDHEVWPLVEISELAANHKGAMRTGPFGSNLLHSEFTPEGDVAVLGIDNAVQNRFAWGERRFISNDKYQELQNYRIFPGDVIVTIMGTIGRSAVIPDDIPVAINTKHLAAITVNREVANPLFLSYSIHSSPSVLKQFASKNRGAIMSGLNLGIIKETKIKRPPIALQNGFSEIHTHVDQLKFRYQQSLSDLESLYGALSQQAFKGELDLSRVPMPRNEPEEEKTVAAEPLQIPAEQGLVIHLPDTDNLLAALETAESRVALITQWLEAYRVQLGSTLFSVQHFMAAAQNRLAELHPDNDFELGANDYEHIKAWVFDALAAGTLTQAFDDAGNRIELKAAQA